MDIRCVAQGRELRPWAELAVQRVQRSVGRLGWWVAAVQIRLRDLNGPRGGLDKECQLQLRSRQGRSLVLTLRGSQWPQLLAQVAEGLSAQLARAHERQRPRPPKAQRLRLLPIETLS